MSTTGGTALARQLIRADDGIPVDTPRVPAREAAERELSRPMYHENDPNLLQRALNRFWEWVGGLFDSASGAAPGGPLGLVVIALIVVALFAALWWRLGTPRRIPGTEPTLFDEGPRSAAEHRTTADTHAAAGRWNQAAQERMRAIVRSLEERALLDPRPGRTADEAASEAGRPLPGHAARLRTAAREFDDITYGGRTADEETYRRLSTLDLDLESAKPQLSTASGGTAE
ncbi:DUF4129 domain-containing protein [Streptomyces scopuliridis]|uniref:DUF4129 domain-containing protein n=1 Tax=Streptomyces scopuliridis TaxID=452529 RepID=A0ACD4ZP44_9ACTN|nr:DUF4129 domain-containing protein [Streptomyces scopuliridis]WSB99791.1 DUF4129 domain-containing protein [Streptomyces scopuliridis]WSC06510.1 DUF4129 domain-containing protein [Streptomyces scopuliridis]